MAIEKANWDDVIRSLPNMGYQHPIRCVEHIKEVRSMFPDVEPYVATLPTREVLLLMKGTLLPAPNPGCPPVIFVITLQHPFPNSYPILTVEEPKAPFRIKNHPNVDTSGQTYLGTVSQWNPTTSKMVQCCQELQTALLSNYPFENAQQARGPAPPPAQPLNHQPVQQQHQAPPPQQQHRPVQQPQQQSYQRRQDFGGHTDEYDMARAVARGTVAAATTTVALMSAAVDAGNAMTGGGTRSSRSAVNNNGGVQQQRNYQGRQLNQAQAQQERMKQDFILLMQGKISVAPGTEILCPRGFGPSAFMTSKTNIDAGLLTPGQAPLPGPACTDPTPEEHHKQALEKQKLDQQRADAAASQDKKSSAGWKALSAVGRFAGKAASKAKNAVEDKVRESSFEGDKKKFATEFPEDAASQTLIMQYECSCLSGDAVSRPGHVFICEKRVYFSGVFESKASKEQQQADPATAPVPFKFCIPYEKLVSVMKGEACGKKFLHLFTDDGTFRSFLSFKDSTASMIGSYASVSMSTQGDTYARCWNWLDHTWRKATLVPSPTYHYYGQAGPLGYPQGYQPGQPTPQPTPTAGPSAGYPAASSTSAGGVSSAPPPAAPPLKTGLYDAPAPQQQGRSAPATTSPTPEKEPAELPEGKECCVCLEAQKNAFFQPCGHVACCLKCANQIDVCPICRGKIMQVFPAFI